MVQAFADLVPAVLTLLLAQFSRTTKLLEGIGQTILSRSLCRLHHETALAYAQQLLKACFFPLLGQPPKQTQS